MSAPADTPLADVTMAVQAELTRLAALAVDIQETFGEALVIAASSQPESLAKAQGLDLLAQHLFGVADFLEALAPHLPPDWAVDPTAASRAVRLSDLSAHLAGRSAVAEANEELELFFD
ncbi:MAG: hypothetical protein WA840_01520 [Caulobacteraceae bacterium]